MTSSPHDPERDANGWASCPSGEFLELSRRLRARQRRQLLARVAVTVGGVGGVVGLAIALQPALAPVNPPLADVLPPLTCREFHTLAPQYVAGRLPVPDRQRMDEHRDRCAPCRRLLAEGPLPG